jgi:hypothetical protein
VKAHFRKEQMTERKEYIKEEIKGSIHFSLVFLFWLFIVSIVTGIIGFFVGLVYFNNGGLGFLIGLLLPLILVILYGILEWYS